MKNENINAFGMVIVIVILFASLIYATFQNYKTRRQYFWDGYKLGQVMVLSVQNKERSSNNIIVQRFKTEPVDGSAEPNYYYATTRPTEIDPDKAWRVPDIADKR